MNRKKGGKGTKEKTKRGRGRGNFDKEIKSWRNSRLQFNNQK